MKEEDVTEQIAALAKIRVEHVASIRQILRSGEPASVQEASAICGAKFATEEEKAGARAKWAERSRKEIEEAVTFDEVEKALRACDSSNKELMLLALEKAITLHKKLRQLEELIFRTRDIPDAIRKEMDKLTRAAMIKYAVNPKAAIALWIDFAGSEDEQPLLAQTVSLLQQIASDDNSKAALWELFVGMPDLHPKRFDVYTRWADCPQTEEELREVHARLSRNLEATEKSASGYSGSREEANKKAKMDYLKMLIDDLRLRIDKKHQAAVEAIEDYDKLVESFGQTEKPELSGSKRAVTVKLESLWDEKVKGCKDFEEAYAIFETMLRVYRTCKTNPNLNKAWEKMQSLATSQADADRMIKIAGYSNYSEPAIQFWLTFNPELDDLTAMHRDASSSRLSPLEDAIIKKSDSVEKAVSTLGLSWTDTGRLKAAQNLASKVSSLEDGITALGPMENGLFSRRGERSLVLEAALKQVSNIPWFKVVVNLLGDYKEDQEERLLVKKALELIKE